MVCPNTMASLNKTEHKNIGVYVLCRILPNGEADYFRREAEWLGTRNIRPDQKNITLYTDEVRIGEKNNHTNLDRLIEDAVAGKVDHIIIANVLDLWHSPQKIFDTVQKLKQLETPVTIQSFPTSMYWTMRNPIPFDDWEGALLLNSLHALRMVNDLQFVYENYEVLSKRVRNGIIYRCIDPEMFEEYLLFYYLEPREMELKEFAQQAGLDTDDIDVIKECWSPSAKQHDAMIEIMGKEFVAFYLA